MQPSRLSSSPWLGLVALAYVGFDFWRDVTHGSADSWLWRSVQPTIWGLLAIAALLKVPSYKYWHLELRAVPLFLAAMVFMLVSLAVEACFIQFVTVVMGLKWHRETAPLPDTGQWLLLALNTRLPSAAVALLRAPIIGLHHFVMLFVMLGFSCLFGFGRPPHMALAARYMAAMGVGRLARLLTFAATILPSPRPWCADTRFHGNAEHPHPWAARFYAPYAHDHTALRALLRTDTCPAVDPGSLPLEYTPDWGLLSFLLPLLRPPVPPESGGRHDWQGANWAATLTRASGGCNDLAFSGHMLVAGLTALAWQEVYPGWGSAAVWALLLHSGQREIRERHHYSLDVVLAMFMSVGVWKCTERLWAARRRWSQSTQGEIERLLRDVQRAAKDRDVDAVSRVLEGRSEIWEGPTIANDAGARANSQVGLLISLSCLMLGVLAFFLMRGG